MAEEQTQQYDEQSEEQFEELPEEQSEELPEELPSEVVQVVTVDDVAYISTDAASAAVDGAVGLDDEYQQQVLGEITSLGHKHEHVSGCVLLGKLLDQPTAEKRDDDRSNDRSNHRKNTGNHAQSGIRYATGHIRNCSDNSLHLHILLNVTW